MLLLFYNIIILLIILDALFNLVLFNYLISLFLKYM